MAVVERAPQAVGNHRVDDRAVAHAEAFPDARQQVGGVAHRLHAAGHGDVDVARRNALRREHHRLQAGPADLVDRHRGDAVVEAAVERRLPGGVLAVARLQHVAHDALVDEPRFDAGARHGFPHHQGAECGGREVLQGTEELAGRGSDGRDDDGLADLHVNYDAMTQGAGFAPEVASGRYAVLMRRISSGPRRCFSRVRTESCARVTSAIQRGSEALT